MTGNIVSAREELISRLRESCADDSFVRLTLSSPRRADAAVQRVIVRLIALAGAPHLSFTFREERRDTTHNLPLTEAFAEVERRLRTEFRGATLATTAADWQLQAGDGSDGRLIRHRATHAAAPARVHDEKKPTLLGEAAQPWLAALGLVDNAGRPRRKLADKHTQIDRYVEILAHLARDAGLAATDGDRPLRIVDVGCGKGHLTFAAWHLGRTVLGRRVQVTGVEARQDLVDEANAVARSLGADDLRFVHGDIDRVPLDGVDVLVALHACNTATDHAIRRGVEAGARLVVVAPCCHQEVRPQLGRPEPLAPVLRHGLFAERMAEWATDGLRTLVLEHRGYATKAIEFVSSEHTPKNVMLAAVRATTAPDDAQRAKTRAAIDAFRAFFGISRQALDPLLRGD